MYMKIIMTVKYLTFTQIILSKINLIEIRVCKQLGNLKHKKKL